MLTAAALVLVPGAVHVPVVMSTVPACLIGTVTGMRRAESSSCCAVAVEHSSAAPATIREERNMYFLLKSRKQWGENPTEGYSPGSKSVKAAYAEACSPAQRPRRGRAGGPTTAFADERMAKRPRGPSRPRSHRQPPG